MSSSIPSIKVPLGKTHPIWNHYVYSTNIYNVMRRMLRSFMISNADFNLLPVEDQNETNLFLELIENAYPLPKSTIMAEFSHEQMLINMLYRIFGFYNNPALKFPRPPTFNSGYRNTLESIFLIIAQGIWSKGSTFQLLSDPAALLEGLINLKEMLLPSQTNAINYVNTLWTNIFLKFFTILDNTKLMRDKLGLVEIGRDQILIALGRKFGVHVPHDTLYRFDLAEHLHTFLILVETTNWDMNKTEELINESNVFKHLFNAYAKVEKRDFKREVQFTIPQGARYV
jgi:hypothetical protein